MKGASTEEEQFNWTTSPLQQAWVTSPLYQSPGRSKGSGGPKKNEESELGPPPSEKPPPIPSSVGVPPEVIDTRAPKTKRNAKRRERRKRMRRAQAEAKRAAAGEFAEQTDQAKATGILPKEQLPQEVPMKKPPGGRGGHADGRGRGKRGGRGGTGTRKAGRGGKL